MTEQWSYEYLPFTNNQTGEEIPNFRINFTDNNKEGYVAETDENLPLDEQERYARLIAAAPDLLAAVIASREMFYTLGDRPTQESKDCFALFEMCDAALAKAEGR